MIGSVGGQKIPPVDRYIAGYQAGAKKASPGITTLNAYSQDFVDQAKCKEIALNQIARGAHVVFQVAGQCGLGALSAAKEKNVRGIGVDADQAYLGAHVLTSALKKVDVAVYQTVQAVQDGRFSGGENSVFDVASGGVGLGQIASDVPADLVAEVNRVQNELAAGKIRNIPETGRRTSRVGARQAAFRLRVGCSAPADHPTCADRLRSPRMDERPVLELRGITKRFPGIVANDNVDFDLRKGEVHALLGENGAGKSTLMNVLYGLYRPDEGEILINGKPVELGSPKAAIEGGIGMVHQHFMLIPVMTVAENIVLATEPVRNGVLLDYAVAEKRVQDISTRFGLAVDPHATVQDITVGQQQRVEILKALYRGADILVLDEPTAVLTPQEAQELFAIIRSLTEQGKSIIFISHKLNEVLEIADRITVLRRGKKIETLPAAGRPRKGLARLMVGREVLLRVEKGPANPAAPLLQVEGLTVLTTTGGSRRSAASRSRCAPARSSASPASTATARPS